MICELVGGPKESLLHKVFKEICGLWILNIEKSDKVNINIGEETGSIGSL